LQIWLLWDRVHPFEAHVPLGAGNQIGHLAVDVVQSGKADVRPVHHIKAPGLIWDDVQYVDIVKAGIRDEQKVRHGCLHVIEGVHLYAPPGPAELRPPKNTQAKVYGGGVKGVHAAFQVNLEIVPVTAFPGLAHQCVGELLEDPVAPLFVGHPEIPSPNGDAETQMVVFWTVRLKAQHQVAHAVPCGKLAEHHAEHLVPTGKTLDVPVPLP